MLLCAIGSQKDQIEYCYYYTKVGLKAAKLRVNGEFIHNYITILSWLHQPLKPLCEHAMI